DWGSSILRAEAARVHGAQRNRRLNANHCRDRRSGFGHGHGTRARAGWFPPHSRALASRSRHFSRESFAEIGGGNRSRAACALAGDPNARSAATDLCELNIAGAGRGAGCSSSGDQPPTSDSSSIRTWGPPASAEGSVPRLLGPERGIFGDLLAKIRLGGPGRGRVRPGGRVSVGGSQAQAHLSQGT